MTPCRRDLALAAGGAALAAAVGRAGPTGGGWQRLNYRGAPVSLRGGFAVTVAALPTAAVGALLAGQPRGAAAALTAGTVAALTGAYDDHAVDVQWEPPAKGFAGHLRELRRGQLSSGIVKLVGIGTAGLASGALTASRVDAGRLDALLTGVLVAGGANLANLLDVRPGRALKGSLAAALALRGSGVSLVAGPVGAAAAVLPAELAERVMLGDLGANALGALVGLAVAVDSSRLVRMVAAAAILGLTGLSEVASFSALIEANPLLRRLDQLGRRR